MSNDERKAESLEDLATRTKPGFFAEYIAFLQASKKWWLIPILVAVLLLGVLTLLAATGAAPFIYTLF